MTETTRSPQDEPLDSATVQADELLLDALARGDGDDTDDEVGTLLATWRADLSAEMPQTSAGDIRNSSAAETMATAMGDRRTSRRDRRPLRVRIAVAAAVVGVLAGGTAIGALHATPGSPLWAVSQVIDPARAQRVAAEYALAQARQAIADNRPDEAERLLDKAATLISQVRDAKQAAQLRAELAQVRQLLVNSTTSGAPLPPYSPGPRSSSSPATTAHPSPAPHTSAGGAGPGLPGQVLPGSSSVPGPLLPTGPLHSLLPTTLPSLPLPGLGG